MGRLKSGRNGGKFVLRNITDYHNISVCVQWAVKPCIYNEIWKPVNENCPLWSVLWSFRTILCKSMGINSHTHLGCLQTLSATHPKAKTSDCLEKGSLSSSVSGESCWIISGARWHSQPLGIRSLSSLRLPAQGNWRCHMCCVFLMTVYIVIAKQPMTPLLNNRSRKACISVTTTNYTFQGKRSSV